MAGITTFCALLLLVAMLYEDVEATSIANTRKSLKSLGVTGPLVRYYRKRSIQDPNDWYSDVCRRDFADDLQMMDYCIYVLTYGQYGQNCDSAGRCYIRR